MFPEDSFNTSTWSSTTELRDTTGGSPDRFTIEYPGQGVNPIYELTRTFGNYVPEVTPTPEPAETFILEPTVRKIEVIEEKEEDIVGEPVVRKIETGEQTDIIIKNLLFT